MIFNRARAGKAASPEEKEKFSFYLMVFFGQLDAAKDWTKQLHLGAFRNINSQMAARLGPDTVRSQDSRGNWSRATVAVGDSASPAARSCRSALTSTKPALPVNTACPSARSHAATRNAPDATTVLEVRPKMALRTGDGKLPRGVAWFWTVSIRQKPSAAMLAVSHVPAGCQSSLVGVPVKGVSTGGWSTACKAQRETPFA